MERLRQIQPGLLAWAPSQRVGALSRAWVQGVRDAGGRKVQTAQKKGSGGNGRNLGHRVRTQRMVREWGREMGSAAKAERAQRGRGGGSKAWIRRLP